MTGVVLSSGLHWGDFPRGVAVDVSSDGMVWKEVQRASGAAGAVTAALASPTTTSMVVLFPSERARYVRVRQTGRSSFHWTIVELRILGEPVARHAGTAGAGPSNQTLAPRP